MKKISVIVPVYNVESYIEKSLLSALNQTYDNIEYVIVDDCGSDNSISIVGKLKNQFKDKDIKIIHHTHNRGLSAARNTGIVNSTGEYIYFMDPDDTISHDCIEEHLNAIQKYDADFTNANIRVIGGRQKLFKTIKDVSLINTSDILIGCFVGDILITACNKLYNKEFIVKNNFQFVEGLVFEDIIWTIDLAQIARKVVMIPDFTYHYYIRGESITTSVSIKNVIKKHDSLIYVLNHIIHIYQRSQNKKLLRSISKWLSKIRFKTSAKLVSMDIDENTKKEIFSKINTNLFKKHSRGVYSYLCNMPYPIFKAFTYIPYTIFNAIKKLKYNR